MTYIYKESNDYKQIIKLCDDLIRDYYKHNCTSQVDINKVKQLRAEAVKGLNDSN